MLGILGTTKGRRIVVTAYNTNINNFPSLLRY